jgi:hypothetical protein
LKEQLPDWASRFFDNTSRHPLTYGKKVGQVVFAVGQVEIQTPCSKGQAKEFVEH